MSDSELKLKGLIGLASVGLRLKEMGMVISLPTIRTWARKCPSAVKVGSRYFVNWDEFQKVFIHKEEKP